MTSPALSADQNIQISTGEIRLLLQSLDHCLATCTKKAADNKDGPCEDCESAKNLRQRLSKLVSP